MLNGLAKSLFGSSNDRYVKSLNPLLAKIASRSRRTLQALTDADLAHQTVLFRERLAAGTKLDDLLPEAFATVREAARSACLGSGITTCRWSAASSCTAVRSPRCAPARARRW